ncbi:hypothetical protein JTB14_013477 [Gonioctena quinquepunctata]|nr:hypothetical protein JTB14_013477 [Gonioctena quinquepunctata]
MGRACGLGLNSPQVVLESEKIGTALIVKTTIDTAPKKPEAGRDCSRTGETGGKKGENRETRLKPRVQQNPGGIREGKRIEGIGHPPFKDYMDFSNFGKTRGGLPSGKDAIGTSFLRDPENCDHLCPSPVGGKKGQKF